MIDEILHSTGAVLLRQLYQLEIENVPAEISPSDTMLEEPDHYFSVGQSAMRCIRLAMLAAGRDDFRRILDFGSGYGRVLRILKAAFPAANLTACDISQEACDFCASAFGATPVDSSETVEQIRIPGKFDLIWCGTLLTNVDAPHFQAFLNLFDSLLAEDGVLVFTTHGPWVAHRMRNGLGEYGLDAKTITGLVKDYESTGFAYADYPKEVRERLGVKRYGISVTAPHWVLNQLERIPALQILNYTEKSWDRHQDAVACIKRSW